MALALPIAAPAAMAEAIYSIDALLERMVARSASDLHVTVGTPPAMRVNGALERDADVPSLTPDDTHQMLYRILSTEQQKLLEINRQIDLAHSIPGLARFRVNVFFQRGTLGAAFRLIPTDIKTLEELGLPTTLHALTDKPRGLVLITGPTGSGKSTTLAALIDEINRKRSEHILTIEDPVEFVHRHKRCIVNQREIGPDATSFAEALRSALREDPDVILLGEMRDLETISTAITAAETGHLVFATLHTQTAPSTVDRIIDAFPASQQEQVRVQLATTLQGICTQALLPTADGNGRVAALEILFPDDAVRNLIRQGKVEQIYSVMQTGTSKGMQTMEQALAELVLRKVITLEEGLGRSTRPEQLFGLLERAGMDVTDKKAPGGDAAPLAAGLRVAEG
jgi:twitching motility protein PilT